MHIPRRGITTLAAGIAGATSLCVSVATMPADAATPASSSTAGLAHGAARSHPTPQKPGKHAPKPPKGGTPTPAPLTEAQAEALAQTILTSYLKPEAVVTGTVVSTHSVRLNTDDGTDAQPSDTTVTWTTKGAADDRTPYTTCSLPETNCSSAPFGTGTIYTVTAFGGYGYELFYVRGDNTVITFSQYTQNADGWGSWLPVAQGSSDGALLQDARWDQVVTSLA